MIGEQLPGAFRRVISLLCLGLCLIPLLAPRAQPLPPIHLVTGNDYAPFADRDLPGGGMITEIVVAAFKAVGRDARITFRPWRRGFMGVERGIYAGTFPHFSTPELSQRFYFSQAIYPMEQRIYVAANSGIKFESLDGLAGLRLCSPIGHVINSSLQKLIYTATISIISPASTEICARMLERGRVDFMALDHTVYQYMLGTLNLKPVGRPLTTSNMYLLFPKNNPESQSLLWEFNNGLEIIKECGLFDKIIRRHLHRRFNRPCIPGEICEDDDQLFKH